jgi:predicted Zn-dependent protease
LSSRSSGTTDRGPELPPECEGLTPEEYLAKIAADSIQAAPDAHRTILAAREVCSDVGYLCAEVATEGSLDLLHWPTDTRLIRVWVPEPNGLPPNLARAFQNAAAKGIRTWHGHPIPLSIRVRASAEPADVIVQWARTVEDNRLGRAQVEWIRTGGEVQVNVLGLTIATHNPGDSVSLLDPDQIVLVAAHEMGHILGLPHSDDSRDVMFPTNTATRLTARDFRTIEALYSLPNGAEIRR